MHRVPYAVPVSPGRQIRKFPRRTWFHRRELPDAMALVVRNRIEHAFDRARGVFRLFDEPGSDDSQ